MNDVASPWPAGGRFEEDGLSIQGVPASLLAERYGTPLLVIDEDDLRTRCAAFAEAFPRVLFAVKALTTHLTVRAALDAGLGLLCSTEGELEACLRAGAEPEQIALHGNNKSDTEIRSAVQHRIGLLMADNAQELERVERVAAEEGVVQTVLLRVTPGVETDTHDYLDTGGLDSKFGTPVADGRALETLRLGARLPHVDVVGLHAHVGSQIFDTAPLSTTVDVLMDLAADAKRELDLDVRVLDVGGGFGVTYTDEQPAEPAAIGRALLDHVAVAAGQRGLAVPEVIVEPGRAIVANPVVTLYRVGVIKQDASGRTLVAVDGGMSDNIRPALYGARYAVARASGGGAAETAPATVVGRHCESGDILATDVLLPTSLGTDDLLAFAATGAYTYSMASNYNRVGRPAIVAVRGGVDRLVVRREDAGDMDRLEVPETLPIPTIEVPEGVRVRAARPADARAFHRMWKDVVAEGWLRTQDLRDPVKTYKRLFKDPWSANGAWIVAVRDDEILGLVSLTREQYPATRHVASLGIGVAAAARGEGIGAALMGEAFRWAESVGVRRVILSVYPDNARAMALYRRFGFVEEGRFRDHSRRQNGYGDEILMGRWIG